MSVTSSSVSTAPAGNRVKRAVSCRALMVRSNESSSLPDARNAFTRARSACCGEDLANFAISVPVRSWVPSINSTRGFAMIIAPSGCTASTPLATCCRTASVRRCAVSNASRLAERSPAICSNALNTGTNSAGDTLSLTGRSPAASDKAASRSAPTGRASERAATPLNHNAANAPSASANSVCTARSVRR